MRLELDIGNTRVKWRLLDRHAQLVDRGDAYTRSQLEAIEKESFPGFMKGLPVTDIASVAMASVVPDVTQVLQRWFVDNTSVCVFVAEVQRYCAGVTNAYEEVGQMGVDRWLAMLAAHERAGSPVLVVDVGSAITVDAISYDGDHLGGYIAPGLDMMSRALFSNTGKVRVASQEYPVKPSLGCSTESAVVAALPVMGVGLIQYAYRELVASSGDATPELIVTGGNGRYYTGLLLENGFLDVKFVEDLVLDGLVLAESQYVRHSSSQTSD